MIEGQLSVLLVFFLTVAVVMSAALLTYVFVTPLPMKRREYETIIIGTMTATASWVAVMLLAGSK
jgi:hypothetical protein